MSDLPAGRELDALVAEKVMGWRLGNPNESGFLDWHDPNGEVLDWTTPEGWSEHDHNRVWSPSTDIAAAWEVVEKLKALDPRISFANDMQLWMVVFEGAPGMEYAEYEDFADTAPLAISRAALKAVGTSPT